MDTGCAKPDCYLQLDEVHKLVEELKAKLNQTETELQGLKTVINTHHNKIFSPKKEER